MAFQKKRKIIDSHCDFFVISTDGLVGIGALTVGIAAVLEILWLIEFLSGRLSQAAEFQLRAEEEKPKRQSHCGGKNAHVENDGSC